MGCRLFVAIFRFLFPCFFRACCSCFACFVPASSAWHARGNAVPVSISNRSFGETLLSINVEMDDCCGSSSPRCRAGRGRRRRTRLLWRCLRRPTWSRFRSTSSWLCLSKSLATIVGLAGDHYYLPRDREKVSSEPSLSRGLWWVSWAQGSVLVPAKNMYFKQRSPCAALAPPQWCTTCCHNSYLTKVNNNMVARCSLLIIVVDDKEDC